MKNVKFFENCSNDFEFMKTFESRHLIKKMVEKHCCKTFHCSFFPLIPCRRKPTGNENSLYLFPFSDCEGWETKTHPRTISYRASDSFMSLLALCDSRVEWKKEHRQFMETKRETETARVSEWVRLLNKGASGVLSGCAGYLYIFFIDSEYS